MKAAAAILSAMLLLSACGDGTAPDLFSPADASQIEGLWQRQHGIQTTYYFSDGYALFQSWAGGQVVIRKEYAYHTGRDTVYLREFPDGQPEEKWLVRFADPNTVGVVAPADSVSLFFTLKRM